MRKRFDIGTRKCLAGNVALSFFTILTAIIAPAFMGTASGYAATGEIQIHTLSARPDMITGGDVLVRIEVPAAVDIRSVHVTLNNADVTSVFRDDAGHTLTGIVTGLVEGNNSLAVAAGSSAGKTPAAKLTLVNHPITGRFCGSEGKPICLRTQDFKLRSGGTLGQALDANCSVKTRIDYLYGSKAGGDLKPLPDPKNPPADVAQITPLGRDRTLHRAH